MSHTLLHKLREERAPHGVRNLTSRWLGLLASSALLVGGCATPAAEPLAIDQPAAQSTHRELRLLTGSRIPRAVEAGQSHPFSPFPTLVIDRATLDTTGGFSLAEQLRRITPIVGR